MFCEMGKTESKHFTKRWGQIEVWKGMSIIDIRYGGQKVNTEDGPRERESGGQVSTLLWWE